MASASRSGSTLTNSLKQYGFALLAVASALLIRGALHRQLGFSVPYITLFPAVTFTAWYCGVWPSVMAIVLAIMGAKYWFIPPIHSFSLPPAAHWIGMLLFLLACAPIVLAGERRRAENDALRRAQGALEDRVRERTVELDKANQSLRGLTARLLQLQDEERRRFARELHDSVGQMLAALSMNLTTVRSDIERLAKTASALGESESLVQEMSKEVRTISHLLHPPLLDEAGLSSALRWYVEGFAERSRIKVALEMPDNFGRFSRELETAVFRVVQECLTNIHRHSESPSAKVCVAHADGLVLVEVKDRGKGIPTEKLAKMESNGVPGVGIRGMRERIRQLGGDMNIDSDGNGTNVRVHLPVAGASTSAAA